MSACNKMKTEFAVTLRIALYKWCDLLTACDNTKVWSNNNLGSFNYLAWGGGSLCWY